MPTTRQQRIEELRRLIAEEGADVLDTESVAAMEEPTTCGTCHRTWDDAVVGAPSGRCPFEGIHEEIEELRRLEAGLPVRSSEPRQKGHKRQHGDPATCFWCKREVVWDHEDPEVGVGDWMDEHGDTGCEGNPITGEDGTGGHATRGEVVAVWSAFELEQDIGVSYRMARDFANGMEDDT